MYNPGRMKKILVHCYTLDGAFAANLRTTLTNTFEKRCPVTLDRLVTYQEHPRPNVVVFDGSPLGIFNIGEIIENLSPTSLVIWVGGDFSFIFVRVAKGCFSPSEPRFVFVEKFTEPIQNIVQAILNWYYEPQVAIICDKYEAEPKLAEPHIRAVVSSISDVVVPAWPHISELSRKRLKQIFVIQEYSDRITVDWKDV